MARRHARFLIVLSVALGATACEAQLPAEKDGKRWADGRVLVKFRQDADPALVEEARLAIGTAGYEKLPLVGADALFFEPAVPVEDALGALAAYGDLVEYAEPDFLYDPAGSPTEFDGSLLWGLARIQAPVAWTRTEGSTDVVVAVIDTGVDTSHPDLAENVWRNTDEIPGNGVDDDGNGYPDDVNGWDFVNGDPTPNDDVAHGTHVAGTIGAVGGDGGIVGVSPNVRIMALKTLSPYGGTTSGNIKAIDYARRNGARVINASWGSYGYSNALRDAVARAGEAGVLFVAAAGNGDQYGRGLDADSSPMFPASYDLPNIVSVAASGGNDGLVSFSNYGAVTVDLVAPGADIASTVPGGEYAYMDGTSMAAPHVAGAAALVLAAAPELSVGRLRDALLETVDPVSSLEDRVATGGRLNVNRAVAQILPDGEPAPEEPGEPEAPGEEPPSEEAWSWAPASGGSAHPYEDDTDQTWSASEPGASEIRLRFSQISTEPGYDFVILYDAEGNEVARYDGELGEVESVSVPGDTVYIRLVTDYSITGYGFEVSEFGWR